MHFKTKHFVLHPTLCWMFTMLLGLRCFPNLQVGCEPSVACVPHTQPSTLFPLLASGGAIFMDCASFCGREKAAISYNVSSSSGFFPSEMWIHFSIGRQMTAKFRFCVFSLTCDKKNLKDMIFYWCSVWWEEGDTLQEKKEEEKERTTFILLSQWEIHAEFWYIKWSPDRNLKILPAV